MSTEEIHKISEALALISSKLDALEARAISTELIATAIIRTSPQKQEILAEMDRTVGAAPPSDPGKIVDMASARIRTLAGAIRQDS